MSKTTTPPTPDTRTIAERVCAVKRKLATGCLDKRGFMKIHSQDIYYVMNDDVMELLRQMLGEEGVDVRQSMRADTPPKEVLVKTKNGTSIEVLCLFEIHTSAGEEKQTDYWWAQASDIGVCASYVSKEYFLKRFQLSGGYLEGPGHGAEQRENVPTEHLPSNQKNYANLNVPTDKAAKMDVSGPQPIAGNGPPAPPEPPQATDLVDDLSGPNMTAEEAAQPGNPQEIQMAWDAWRSHYKDSAPKELKALLPHLKNTRDMTRGDLHAIWTVLNGGDEI